MRFFAKFSFRLFLQRCTNLNGVSCKIFILVTTSYLPGHFATNPMNCFGILCNFLTFRIISVSIIITLTQHVDLK
jgi:hypothetical protein